MLLMNKLFLFFPILIISIGYVNGLEEQSTILQTGILSTATKDYQISNDLQIRTVLDGKLMRISGTTIDGYPYYVIHRLIDDEIQVWGKIFLDNKLVPIIYRSQPISEPEQQPEGPELLLIVYQPHSTCWSHEYKITTRVYDADLNPNANFDQKSGYLEGVKVNVTLTHENGQVLTTFGGITDDHGYYTGKFYVTENIVKAGKYNVQVTGANEAHTVTQEFITFIFGTTSFSEGTKPC